MIKGVTHSQEGNAIQRLSVSTKVAIGLPPTEGKNHPSKLDHFVFLKKKKVAKGVDWELDPELMKFYGSECKEFRVVLIDDDLDNVFPTSLSWWTATERKCWGDGQDATRRTEKVPKGESWHPCGDECIDKREGRCKPSGDLRFVLADFPRLGSVCRIHTSSYRSVRQIYSALQEIQGFTGGRLAGLTATLIVRPEEGSYFDPKDGKKKSTTIWALSLEVVGQDMKKLMSNLTENAQVFINARKLLGGHVLEVVETEAENAEEIAKEFYPPSQTQDAPEEVVTMPRRASESVPEETAIDVEPELPEGKPGEPEGNPEPPLDEGDEVKRLSVAERDEIFKLAKTVGFQSKQAVKDFIHEKFGFEETGHIPASIYGKVLKAVTEWKSKPAEVPPPETSAAPDPEPDPVENPKAAARGKKKTDQPPSPKADPKISEDEQKKVLEMARTYCWMKGSGKTSDAFHIFLQNNLKCSMASEIPQMALELLKKVLREGPVAVGLEVAK